MASTELKMVEHPEAATEGFLYEWELNLPEGVQFAVIRGGNLDPPHPVDYWGYVDGNHFVELYAVHHLWGPSDACRGKRWDGQPPLTHVKDEEITELWEDPWGIANPSGASTRYTTGQAHRAGP